MSRISEEEVLFDLLKKAVSPFASVAYARGRLLENGFTEINFDDDWSIEKGGRYVVTHHGTTLFAFTVGSNFDRKDMVRIAAAHTDYPCLRVKPNPDFVTKGYGQINMEVYGGPILSTWFDRPLGITGRVVVKSDDVFKPEIKYYTSDKPVMIIPNLAIHMNRDVNKGVEINNQTDLMPIVDLLPEDQKDTGYFMEFIASELGVAKDDILDFELNTYCMEEPKYVGVRDTMISSPRLDNQTSVSALLSAVIYGERKNGINLIALFDHEEVGSTSKQGAASILMHDMLFRILGSLGLTNEECNACLYDAMMLSADVAHALHPNKIGKMDITNQPVLNRGFIIKQACAQSYATDSEAIAILRQICDKHDIPYQQFSNRSDTRGGGTLGAIASAMLPIKTVDIGVALLAMHSVSELMGNSDQSSLEQAIEMFFCE